ncbi:hypothetical protein MMC06_000513 [Schaereria dolodes]|nr:hypothetical protein [Schaereria dolodes]
MALANSDLPRSDSPTLILAQATDAERTATWKLNGQMWRGPLSLPAYLRREQHLAAQDLTRDTGITYWILVDSATPRPVDPEIPRTILASCETLRKRALVATKGTEVEEIISHGIGSVYCNPDFRGKGYASRMMEELGKVMATFQQQGQEKATFTVLYSDIGKKFYAKNGWQPFPSSHISLPPLPARQPGCENLPRTHPLHSKDIASLCKLDEELLRKKITLFTPLGAETRVALIPDAPTMHWHHAREKFAAIEILGRHPDVKGAIIRSHHGEQAWCIWTRTFGHKEEGNILHILRLVAEGEDIDNELLRVSEADTRVSVVAAVLQAAQREADKWGMRDVQIWNPSVLVTMAARRLIPSATVIDRDADSITSLMWYGPATGMGDDVAWVGNEKYGWC